MKLCSISDFSRVVRDQAGAHIVLSDNLPTSELVPLRVLAGTHDLVVDRNDVGYLSHEATDEVRVNPQALFVPPSVELHGSGVPTVAAQVCGCTIRNRKFFDLAAKRVGAGVQQMKTLEFPSDGGGPALLLAPMESFNYSHWLLEALPKLGLYERAYGKLPDTVVMTGSKMPFHSQSIAYVSPGTKLQRVKTTPVTIKNLSFTTSLAKSVAELSPKVFEFYDAMLRKRFDTYEPARKRLYISRAGASYRKIENEPELVEELLKLGFTVIDPGAYSFSAQVSMFWNAEVVVGAHGAGLANIVFAKSCELVLELLSSGFRDRSAYAHICRHKRITYGAASGEPVTKVETELTGPETWPGHRSFRVDVQRVAGALRRHLQQ